MNPKTDQGELFGRGIAFPPRISPEGRLRWSAGPENIRESIQVILLTEFQERILLPEFGGGLQSYLFEPNTASTHRLIKERIKTTLALWERRIRVDQVTVQKDTTDDQAAIVTIHYRLVATGTAQETSLTMQLTG